MKRTRKLYFKTALLTTADSGERFIKIKFPWTLENLSEIKTIQGRKFYKKKKYWRIPLTLENCFVLKDLKYILKPSLIEWANDAFRRDKLVIKPISVPGLKGTLMTFQAEGVSFLDKFDGRGLIADEMGLGKTVQALAWCQLHSEKKPVVIVCPASLKLNWAHEINKWLTPPKIQILYGTKTDITITGEFIILNYDILSNKKIQGTNKKGELMFTSTGKPIMKDVPHTGWVDFLKKINPQIIILDEVHFIKNTSTRRAGAVIELCENVPHIIELSGTPIESRALEIYNSINILNPNIFSNPWKFKHRYCGAKHNGFGWTFNGASNTEELHNILTKTCMIRRLKKDVLKDLPDKLYSFVPLEIDNREEYSKAEDDFISFVRNNVDTQAQTELTHHLRGSDIPLELNFEKLEQLKDEKGEKATVLAQIEALKQLAVKGAMNSIFKWIDNFLESGEKLIVFCEHLFVMKLLMDRYSKIAVQINGSISAKNRDIAVTNFQTNPRIKLFVGNAAAEVGITLTSACNVAIIEYPWNPGKLDQRTDRAHRIGQKDTVWVHYLMAINTIQAHIATILDSKRKMVSAILDGKEVEECDLITELINKYK